MEWKAQGETQPFIRDHFNFQGGMKAVVWVDNIQVLIMVIGASVLGFKGIIDAGGFAKVWDRFQQGHRTNPFE